MSKITIQQGLLLKIKIIRNIKMNQGSEKKVKLTVPKL